MPSGGKTSRAIFCVAIHEPSRIATTATMTVVDLGTEFGLLSLPGRPDEVHVLEGRVQLRMPQGTDGPELGAGEAAGQ